MREVYRTKFVSDEDVTSSLDSLDSHDEFFCSADSNYSDCELCEDKRRRHIMKSTPLSSFSTTTNNTSYHTANETSNDTGPLLSTTPSTPMATGPRMGLWGRSETVPLLKSANLGYRTVGSSGHFNPPSKGILSSYRKLENVEPEKKKHSSLVTIFSLWNTTMGSSLLTMAWGVARAGLLPALALLVFMGGLCLFTAYVLIKVNKYHGGDTCEVPALCRTLLGRWAATVAHCFSLLVLIGANIVYWILITNFLYFTVNYFMDLNTSNSTEYNSTIFCPNNVNYSAPLPPEHPYWGLHSTVPIYVAGIMFPLLNFRSASFFTKFNSLGTLSVIYLLLFVAIKASTWGININVALLEPRAGKDAAVLSGMLALAFYIHNIIITIMNGNRHQENNGRDLTIAFVLVTLTYMMVGAGFYICFPLIKTCIEDNMLNNFEMHDVLTAVARILLLFQVITVYPLVAFMLRCEAILLLPIKHYYKEKRIVTVLINLCIVAVCVIFATCCPNIGTIIRYTGAVSGLVHIFALPSLLQMKSLHIRGKLTIFKGMLFGTIIFFGAFNFIVQFFITD